MFFVSPANPEPLYQQVVDQLRGLILRGELAPGSPLPSVRQLAEEISASVITTRRAYTELEREGMIVTRQGLGTFVADLDVERRRRAATALVLDELRRVARRAAPLGVLGADFIELARQAAAGAESEVRRADH